MTSYPRTSHREMMTYASNKNCQQSRDHAVEMLTKNHYIFRNGLAQVHVQICDAPPKDDDSEIEGPIDSVIRLAAYMIAVIIVVLTFVIKLSSVIVDDFDEGTESRFMLFLYVTASMWTIYCLIPGVYKEQLLTFSKTNKSSNRWLNCVITLFGLTIFIQDGLQIISFSFINVAQCPAQQVNISLSVFHITFVISQIAYILRYLKVYIQCYSHQYCRVGLMILIGTNLSNWLCLIIDEAQLALKEHSSLRGKSNVSHMTHIPKADPCACHHPFCDAAHLAERFLFPFVIEFCIVASSLLFVIASNIDKQPSPFEKVVKPSYRFFNSIFGVAGGCIAVITTTITINYLASSRVEGRHNFDYFDGFHILQAHNYYMVLLELSMIIASGFGFYYFTKIVQPLESPMLLDVILLSICLIGPIGMDMFSLVSVIGGGDNKVEGWLITLALPFVDILQCVTQFTLILYGLKREALPSTIVQQAAENLRHNVVNELKRHNIICTTTLGEQYGEMVNCRSTTFSFNTEKNDNNATTGADDDANECDDVAGDLIEWRHHYRRRASSYMRHTRTSVVSAMVSIANPANMYQLRRESRLVAGGQNNAASRRGVRHSVGGPPISNRNDHAAPLTNSSVPSLAVPSCDNKNFEITASETDDTLNLETPPDDVEEQLTNDADETANERESVLKFVTETQIPRPMGERTRLRNIIMYLLFSNACLWVFLSLEGTAFDTHPYQLSYYGASAWTTILMICRPLVIFFRMHSAGCLFEIWSYA